MSSSTSDGQPPTAVEAREQRPAGAPACFRHPDRETYLRCHRCERFICTDCMVPAAVGHQCPECVRGGAKTVRQARTVVGGRVHSRQGVATIGLIAVCVVMYGLQQLIGQAFTARMELLGFAVSSSATPSAVNVGVANGEWYRLVTSIFVHESPAHIALNMLSLWWIGVPVESRLGRSRYLLTFLVCGIGASAVSFAFIGRYDSSLGASGAIFGLLGVLAVMAYREKLDMRPILLVIAVNLVFSFSVAGIDWHAHVGGLACGLLLGVAFGYAPRPERAGAWYRNPQNLLPIGAGLVVLAVSAVLVEVHSNTLLNSALAASLAPLIR